LRFLKEAKKGAVRPLFPHHRLESAIADVHRHFETKADVFECRCLPCHGTIPQSADELSGETFANCVPSVRRWSYFSNILYLKKNMRNPNRVEMPALAGQRQGMVVFDRFCG